MASINSIYNPVKLLKYYLQKNSSYENKDFLEQCYQHFLNTTLIKDNNGETVPVSLTATMNQSLNNKDIEIAFTCLKKWNSSYDGVRRIWKILKKNPRINVNEYFDQLGFTQKSFLIEGLKNRSLSDAKKSKDNPKLIKRIRAVNHIIHLLEKRMLSETKSDRVSRVSLEISTKLDNIIISSSSADSSPRTATPPKARFSQEKSPKKSRRTLILKSKSSSRFTGPNMVHTSSTLVTSPSIDSYLASNLAENRPNESLLSKNQNIYSLNDENLPKEFKKITI